MAHISPEWVISLIRYSSKSQFPRKSVHLYIYKFTFINVDLTFILLGRVNMNNLYPSPNTTRQGKSVSFNFASYNGVLRDRRSQKILLV